VSGLEVTKRRMIEIGKARENDVFILRYENDNKDDRFRKEGMTKVVVIDRLVDELREKWSVIEQAIYM
jgi:hypothetical protein